MQELFIIFAGIFAVLGGALDWDWFMNHHKATIFVKMLGRNGARVFYILLGLSVAVTGTLMVLGIIEPQSV